MPNLSFAPALAGNSRCCATWLLLLCCSTTAMAQDVSDDFRDDVLEWVDQLDAPTLSGRQSAEQKLIDAGPKALEYLPEKRAGFSAEAATRLENIRKRLAELRTEGEVTAIVIRLDQADTVSEALEAISRDSGIEFELAQEVTMSFTPIASPLSFWHALDLVLDHANLDINFYASEDEMLMLVPREETRGSRVDAAAYSDVYRIEPVSVTARRVLRQPNLNGLNVSIELAWEPRLTPIGLSIPISALSGRFDDGQKVVPQASGESIDIGSSGDVCFSEFYLPLQLPEASPNQIETLSGKIQAMLPGQRATFEIDLDSATREKTVDAMTVRIEDVRKNGDLHEVRVGVHLDNADRSLESHRQWIFQNPVHIRKPDGSRQEFLGIEVYRQTVDGVGIGYLFDIGDSPTGATLVYESPTSVVQSEVDFLIEDIRLP